MKKLLLASILLILVSCSKNTCVRTTKKLPYNNSTGIY